MLGLSNMAVYNVLNNLGILFNAVIYYPDQDDVPHCQILSSDKTEQWFISATLCGWSRCFMADQLWVMTRIREEKDLLPKFQLMLTWFNKFTRQRVTSLFGLVFRWDQRLRPNGSTLVSAGVEINRYRCALSLTSSATHRWFRRISSFVYELAKNLR